MFIRLLNKKAQSTLEFAVLVTAVAAAIVAMNLYLRRAVNANLKTVERELNHEWEKN